jgi:L-ascorbate metabolism protein UlaG (beta-lactamase superfamily)
VYGDLRSAILRLVQVTKYSHSCVRLELDGVVLVIDPGIWSEPSALYGCDAVLVTHEHSDHIDVLRLAGLGVPVYAPAGSNISGIAVTGLQPGQVFDAAGVAVRAVGGRHAAVYEGRPDCINLGYVIGDGLLYHPGDALHIPEQAVETLLVPVQASWLKTAEAIDFMRAIDPLRGIGIHDAQVNERALGSINGWLEETSGQRYRWLGPGQAA